MTIKIEVTGNAESRTFGENTFYSQEAYWHKEGAKYPILTVINLESLDKAHPLGMYLLNDNESTRVGQYGSMEYTRYSVLHPVKQG